MLNPSCPPLAGVQGWTGLLHRFNYPFIMNMNFHLESYIWPAVHCIVCFCLNKLMDIQAINLPKLLLMPVHPLNPPPTGDSGQPRFQWILPLCVARKARTNKVCPCHPTQSLNLTRMGYNLPNPP